MKIRNSIRGVVGIAAVGAMMLLASSPAHAYVGNRTLWLANDRGAMEHIDDGDKFVVCDTRADGYGVKGTLWRGTWEGSASLVLTVTDGGDSDCDYQTYDIKTGDDYFMFLCWNGDPTSNSCRHMAIEE